MGLPSLVLIHEGPRRERKVGAHPSRWPSLQLITTITNHVSLYQSLPSTQYLFLHFVFSAPLAL